MDEIEGFLIAALSLALAVLIFARWLSQPAAMPPIMLFGG